MTHHMFNSIQRKMTLEYNNFDMRNTSTLKKLTSKHISLCPQPTTVQVYKEQKPENRSQTRPYKYTMGQLCVCLCTYVCVWVGDRDSPFLLKRYVFSELIPVRRVILFNDRDSSVSVSQAPHSSVRHSSQQPAENGRRSQEISPPQPLKMQCGSLITPAATNYRVHALITTNALIFNHF